MASFRAPFQSGSVLVALTLLLAACSTTGSPQSASPAQSGSSANTFVIATNDLASNLDPALAASQPEFQFTKATYETLVNYDSTNNSLVPGLATKWQLSPDSTKLTLDLREGVKFHDDASLTAEGVVASLKRTLKIGKGESYLLSGIKDVTADGGMRVVITLKKPAPEFASGLARIFIVSPKAMTENSGADNGQTWFAKHEAGSGPYVLTGYQPEQQAVYERFDGYWKGWSGNHIQKYVVNVVADPATQLLQIQQKTADWATAIQNDDVVKLRKDTSVNVQVYGGSPFYLMFNTTKGPLRDKNLREAISYAVDYEAINTQVMQGMGERIGGPLPNWMSGDMPSHKPIQQDLARAKSLVSKAGYGVSKPVKISFLYFSGWSFEETIAAVLQADLKKIGIEASVKGAPWPSYTQQASNKATRPDMGAEAVFVATSSPGPVLGASFDPASEGQWTYWGYNNPAFTSLLHQAESTTNEPERLNVYGQAQKLLVDDYAAIWLMQMPDIFVLQDTVKGWKHDPTWGLVPDYYSTYKTS